MQTHFEKYDKIASIRVLDTFLFKTGFGYAIIQFNNGEIKLIEITNEKNGYIRAFTVPACPTSLNIEEKNEKKDKPFSVPVHDSPSNILNALDNYCLMDIFDRCRLEDLGSIADVCNKFNETVERVASQRLKSQTFIFDFNLEDLHNFPERLLRFANFFHYFGKYIQSIDLRSAYKSKGHYIDYFCFAHFYNMAALTTIMTYCIGSSSALKSLKLKRMYIPFDWNSLLQSIFGRLKYLDLDGCGIGSLLMACHNLVEYKSTNAGIEMGFYITLMGSENLKVLQLSNSRLLFWDESDDFLMRDFFARSKNLKELELKNISDLLFEVFIDSLVKGQSSIERFKIEFETKMEEKDVVNISKLNWIKQLDITVESVEKDHLVTLLKNLPNLVKLTVHINSCQPTFEIVKDTNENLNKKNRHILTFKYDRHFNDEHFNEYLDMMKFIMKSDGNTKICAERENRNVTNVTVESKLFSGILKLFVEDKLIRDNNDLVKLY